MKGQQREKERQEQEYKCKEGRRKEAEKGQQREKKRQNSGKERARKRTGER